MPRINTKSFGPEDHILYQVAEYLRIQYKHALFTHVANERMANVQYKVKLKALGVSNGVPDLMIFNPIGEFIGLAIELKAPKGQVSRDQSFWLAALQARGWATFVCRSFEQAKGVLDDYFNNKL
jgi:hypothetical protein